MCNDKTQIECQERSLLGSGIGDLGKIRDITKDCQLFLFNFQSLRLIGVFKPVGQAGRDIVPEAWGGERTRCSLLLFPSPSPVGSAESPHLPPTVARKIWRPDPCPAPRGACTRDTAPAADVLWQ